MTLYCHTLERRLDAIEIDTIHLFQIIFKNKESSNELLCKNHYAFNCALKIRLKL